VAGVHGLVTAELNVVEQVGAVLGRTSAPEAAASSLLSLRDIHCLSCGCSCAIGSEEGLPRLLGDSGEVECLPCPQRLLEARESGDGSDLGLNDRESA